MAFRTAVVIASFLIGLGAVARESFAQYYPPQAYPRPRDYPLAGYPPLPPVEADDDYDLPAGGRSHTGAAGPGQVDPLAPGLMRDDPRTIAALPPEVRPETGPRKELPPQFRRTLIDYYTKQPAGTIVIEPLKSMWAPRACSIVPVLLHVPLWDHTAPSRMSPSPSRLPRARR